MIQNTSTIAALNDYVARLVIPERKAYAREYVDALVNGTKFPKVDPSLKDWAETKHAKAIVRALKVGAEPKVQADFVKAAVQPTPVQSAPKSRKGSRVTVTVDPVQAEIGALKAALTQALEILRVMEGGHVFTSSTPVVRTPKSVKADAKAAQDARYAAKCEALAKAREAKAAKRAAAQAPAVKVQNVGPKRAAKVSQAQVQDAVMGVAKSSNVANVKAFKALLDTLTGPDGTIDLSKFAA